MPAGRRREPAGGGPPPVPAATALEWVARPTRRCPAPGEGSAAATAIEVPEEGHGAGQLAALLLQQRRAADGEHGDGGEKLTQPIRRAGIERQNAAAAAAREVEEQLGISARGPIGCVVQDDEPDAAASQVVRELAAARRRFLIDVADVGDHADAGRGERAREDRQELGMARDTGDRCSAFGSAVNAVKVCRREPP